MFLKSALKYTKLEISWFEAQNFFWIASLCKKVHFLPGIPLRNLTVENHDHKENQRNYLNHPFWLVQPWNELLYRHCMGRTLRVGLGNHSSASFSRKNFQWSSAPKKRPSYVHYSNRVFQFYNQFFTMN